MRNIFLGPSGLYVPTIAVGCMRLNSLDEKQAEHFLETCIEQGANYFDHADIYGGGSCEELFGKALHMNPDKRDKVYIQSKCGIRPGVAFDFSKEHILDSVDGILKRLNTEYLDLLLLHRPDALMDPAEVADAFEVLHFCGKVRYFGVSNQNPAQIQLLQKYLAFPIEVNQLQFSITNTGMIDQGIHVNMKDEGSINRDGSVLDFCRLNDITIQPWSPFQHGFFSGSFIGSEKFPELNAKLDEIAAKYEVSSTTIALAWILRHPAKMQPVIGTMNEEHLKDCLKAADITLTREEWYEIYLAAGNILP